jgi:hypothetical protein
VQNKGFPMTSEARARGFLLIEQEHIVIDQLQDELNLVEIKRIPTDNPVEIQTGPSSPDPMQIEEITGSDNPKVLAPQVRSLGDI